MKLDDRIYWIWRKLHALSDCKYTHAGLGGREEWYTDVGYCLDRYSLTDKDL